MVRSPSALKSERSVARITNVPSGLTIVVPRAGTVPKVPSDSRLTVSPERPVPPIE